MDRAGGNIAVHSYLHFIENGAAIGVVAKPNDREHYCLLEGTEGISHAYIVGYTETLSSGGTRDRYPYRAGRGFDSWPLGGG